MNKRETMLCAAVFASIVAIGHYYQVSSRLNTQSKAISSLREHAQLLNKIDATLLELHKQQAAQIKALESSSFNDELSTFTLSGGY